jgi:hypothetical protein
MATPPTCYEETQLASVELRSQMAVSPVAWKPQQGLEFAEWLHQGRRLGSIGRGVAWWIGDWVSYGNVKFGEKYSRAARVTGYDVQSLMNMAYVASRFEFSRRKETLSWSHHAELAALEPDEQDRWLVFADERRLSVRGLRDELRAWRSLRGTGKNGKAASRARTGAKTVAAPVSTAQTFAAEPVCPRCGYHLEAESEPGMPLPRIELAVDREPVRTVP